MQWAAIKKRQVTSSPLFAWMVEIPPYKNTKYLIKIFFKCHLYD